MAKKQKDANARAQLKARVELNGFTANNTYPEMAVYALNRAGKPIEINRIDREGQFELSDKAVKEAHRISIGPLAENLNEVERSAFTVYRPQQFVETLQLDSVFNIPQKDWLRWIYIKRCVSGSVKRCFPYPWYIDQLVARTQTQQAIASSAFRSAANPLTLENISDARIAFPNDYTIFTPRCEVVCDGIVEVYRRTCCCTPWIIYDPRIPELIKELEDLVAELPEIEWPPRPQPDPPPVQEIPFFKDGALDERVLNAKQDLHAIQTLPPAEVAEYITARPYLWCVCTSPVKVAQGSIHPDGDFNICWYEWPSYTLINCHEEYAYKVTQVHNGSATTIYDGVAANHWYHYGEEAELTSYSLKARGCRHNDFPGDGAFVLLQDIGDTGSWRLKTPAATGWDRVANPVYNDGLSYPAPNPAAAVGTYLNRNWGGTLKLRYHFSEEMKDIGARYYRVSVTASDTNGNPVGPRTYLRAPEWYFYFLSPTLNVDKVALGPHTVNSQSDLYEIPYDADRDWQSGQYHALLDTTQFENGRFLLTVEVFNSAGQLIRPNGTPNPGGSVEGAFTYQRWYQETGPTAEVPYAALTHMLWWDNRKATAIIEDFRVNGAINTDQCQFLEDAGNANFSVGYRAYHPEPMFLLDHRLWWRRGLGGPTGVLTSPHPNPNNVGVALPHQSGSNSFATMLGTYTKCSFTISLHANVKTFNGENILNGLDGWDTGSVALEIV